MMKRTIIRIDEAACIGCGACAEACHEGAIGMVNGKAKLTREDYADSDAAKRTPRSQKDLPSLYETF